MRSWFPDGSTRMQVRLAEPTQSRVSQESNLVCTQDPGGYDEVTHKARKESVRRRHGQLTTENYVKRTALPPSAKDHSIDGLSSISLRIVGIITSSYCQAQGSAVHNTEQSERRLHEYMASRY